jgi:hypothetical protein
MVKFPSGLTLYLIGDVFGALSGISGSEDRERGCGLPDESEDGDDDRGEMSSGRIVGLYLSCGPSPTVCKSPLAAENGLEKL